jgi:hypothetical protein
MTLAAEKWRADCTPEPGLHIARTHYGAWMVIHHSFLSVTPGLRLRRHAEAAKADFEATGVNFTLDDKEAGQAIRASAQARDIAGRWHARAHSDHADPDTGECYNFHYHGHNH